MNRQGGSETGAGSTMQTGAGSQVHGERRGRLVSWTARALVAAVLVLAFFVVRPAVPEGNGSEGVTFLSSKVADPVRQAASSIVERIPGVAAEADRLRASLASPPSQGHGPVVQGSAILDSGGALAVALALAAASFFGAYLLGRSRGRNEVAALKAEMTRREAVERERRRKEAIYRAHYDNTTDTIFAVKVEGDGRFTLADRNPAHEAAFGFEAPYGKEPHEFMPAEVAKNVVAYYRQCVEANAPIRYDIRVELEKGHGFWETVLAPVHDENGTITHVIGASRDITDRIELEERLRQSQKMEALGQLTGGIAHDFNNLLTVVMGNLDLIKRAREVQRPRLIDNALQAVERARDLTQRLLAFGRRQPLNPEPTDLKALIAGMDDMLMQSLRGDVRLELELPNDLWPVEVDQAQLQVALINLAANARDAMPRGGTLRIRAENTPPRDGKTFEGVAVAVTDTGHGMSRAVVDRAFDPFFTTKEAGKGTGLGLAQVYGFANQSGGSAEITSEVDKGTTVTLYLRRCHSPISVRVASSAYPSDMKRDLRILLVEDNVQVAEVAASILEEHDHVVTTAHNADDALRMLENDDRFDFVFSDLVMPGERDGLDLARTVRARWPDLPVLLATGYSEAGGRATQEGFNLLAKPYRAAALVAMIERTAAEAGGGLVRSET